MKTHQMFASVGEKLDLNQHVLGILDKCKHIKHLKQLQAFLIALGHGQTHFYAFKLVRLCACVLTNFRYARFIFDHLPSPNVYLYTAMVTAYTSNSHHFSSLELFRDMVRQGYCSPNQFIYPHVLKSCPEILGFRGTELVHTHILKTGFEQHPVVQTALLDSYSRFCSDIRTARRLFDEMSDRNVVSWTAMLSAYARLGEMGNALLLFEEMPERDVPSWNAAIAGCTQNGLFMEAITLLKRMVWLTTENKPNQVTFVCALSACGHTGMLHLGKCIHACIYRYGIKPGSFISNALVDMYGKCGSLGQARRVFHNTPYKNLTSWNSMINCYALHGQSKNAINVFQQLLQSHNNGDDAEPDGITFVGLLNACTHGGLVEHGQSYFNTMIEEYEIEPEIEHYGCLVDLLGRAGQFEEAMDVVKKMSMPADEVVWGSLLNACKIHGRNDLAEFAAMKLVEIDPKNGGYRSMLANLNVELGKWDEVREVRKLLKEENAYKTPGCSWIEVDNQVHQFYSVDRSHPRTQQICSILEILAEFHQQ